VGWTRAETGDRLRLALSSATCFRLSVDKEQGPDGKMSVRTTPIFATKVTTGPDSDYETLVGGRGYWEP